jgi:hypothetical protein
VLGDNGESLLQGWAIVENNSRYDWNGVRLSLLAGSPISFRMDLAEPIYTQRPEVDVPTATQVEPQVYEETIADTLREPPTASKKTAGAPRRSGPSYAEAEESLAPSPWGRDQMEGSVETKAEALRAGALFEYRLEEPVDLPAQHSAMLPIINQNVETESISIFDSSVLPRNPLRGVKLTNTTGLHIMAGPITIYEQNKYAGDALFDDIVEGAEKLMTYAVDLETEVSVASEGKPDDILLVKAMDGILTIQRTQRRATTYNIAFRGEKKRPLLIEHPKRTSWNIVGKNKPEEETRSSYRFRVAPGDKQYEEFLVTEERKLSETAMLADLSNQKIDFYLERASFSDEIASALTQLQDMRYELTDLNRQKEEVSSRIDEIFRDQSRIRNNLDHLDEQSNLYKQYVRTLTSQEEQLMDLREQRIAIEERIRRKQKEIREYVEGLNIE